MSLDDLKDIAKAIQDLRFIQASAVVALGLKDNKVTTAYMARLNNLQKAVEKEVVDFK